MTVDWSNTVLYLLRSNNPLINDEYVGKSGDFYQRKINHKSSCNNEKSPEYNKKAYIFIRENGGFDNWDFEILETANLEDEDEAAILERYWIETLKPTLNIQLPAQTPEERAEYKNNWQRIKYKQNREDPEFRKKHAEKSKKNREDNPEKTRGPTAKRLEKITCICGTIHSRTNQSTHLKTDKHKNFVKNNPVVN